MFIVLIITFQTRKLCRSTQFLRKSYETSPENREQGEIIDNLWIRIELILFLIFGDVY